jgi:hypothetical protein
MDIGAWLTRGTIWVALSLYVASEIAGVLHRRRATTGWRWLNSIGCAAFQAHFLCAFHFYHHWSHAAAYAETARRTAEFSGLHWGGGLYLNYAMALVWLVEVFWAWANPISHQRRPAWMTWTVRGFFWFMIFNGAVVFVPSAARWIGLMLCATLAVCWLRPRPDTTRPVTIGLAK